MQVRCPRLLSSKPETAFLDQVRCDGLEVRRDKIWYDTVSCVREQRSGWQPGLLNTAVWGTEVKTELVTNGAPCVFWMEEGCGSPSGGHHSNSLSQNLNLAVIG